VDTGDWTLLSLWIHIPVVTLWIGMVMLDVFASNVPGIPSDQRGRMIAWFRPLILVAIAVILVTGTWQTMKNPFTEVNSFDTLERLRESTYGFSLFLKHGFVLATFALTLVVHFLLAPRLAATPVVVPSGGGAVAVGAPPVERTIRLLSWLNLAACLGALMMATRMVWELH